MSEENPTNWKLDFNFESSLGSIQKLFQANKKEHEQKMSLKKRGFEKFEGIGVSESPCHSSKEPNQNLHQKKYCRGKKSERKGGSMESEKSGNLLGQIRFDDLFEDIRDPNPEQWRPVNSKLFKPVGAPEKS